MQVDAVRDHLHDDAVVRQARARHARLAVMQRGLRVEQVRDLRKARVRRRVNIRRQRRRVRRAGDHAALFQLCDHLKRARELRREGHHAHAGQAPHHVVVGRHARRLQALSQLRALVFERQ